MIINPKKKGYLKKWMEIIEEDMEVYGVNKNMVIDIEVKGKNTSS